MRIYTYKCEFCDTNISSEVQLGWAVCGRCTIEQTKLSAYHVECQAVEQVMRGDGHARRGNEEQAELCYSQAQSYMSQSDQLRKDAQLFRKRFL